MSENSNINFHLHFKRNPPLKSKRSKKRKIEKLIYLRETFCDHWIYCLRTQAKWCPWMRILSHARQRFLGTDQLSLFIEALMIVLPFNVGIYASHFFLFWLPRLYSKFDYSNVELEERNYLKNSGSGANWYLSLNTYVFNSQETQQNAVTHAFSDF